MVLQEALYNIFLQDVGGYSSFVASVNCLVAVYFTPMSCLNSTSVLLSVTFRGYALIIRIQVFITNTHNQIISINKAFTTISGYTEQEIIKQNTAVLNAAHFDSDFFREKLKHNDFWQGEVLIGAPSYLMKYLGLLSPNIHSHTERIG